MRNIADKLLLGPTFPIFWNSPQLMNMEIDWGQSYAFQNSINPQIWIYSFNINSSL